MKCPACGAENISGVDDCESCHQDLSSLDGVVPTTKLEKVLMEDPIARLKPREATRVEVADSALEAARRMNRDKVGSALVFRGKDLAGIVTERDIVFKVLAKKKKPAEMKVEAIMTASPDTLDEEDTLAYAVNKMAVGGYRHIPIERRGKPPGIISVRDVLKYLAKLFP